MTTKTKPAPTAPATPTFKLRCDRNKVQIGSVFSRHSFGSVIGFERDQFGKRIAKLRNSTGYEWGVGEEILEQEFSFADQYDDEIKLSRTDILKILVENSHTAMTVVWRKKLDPKLVAKTLAAGQGAQSDKDWNKAVEAALEGESRTMIGHHFGSFNEHGRLKFEEHGEEHQKQIDPRTVDALIVGRVRYVVKD